MCVCMSKYVCLQSGTLLLILVRLCMKLIPTYEAGAISHLATSCAINMFPPLTAKCKLLDSLQLGFNSAGFILLFSVQLLHSQVTRLGREDGVMWYDMLGG